MHTCVVGTRQLSRSHKPISHIFFSVIHRIVLFFKNTKSLLRSQFWIPLTASRSRKLNFINIILGHTCVWHVFYLKYLFNRLWEHRAVPNVPIVCTSWYPDSKQATRIAFSFNSVVSGQHERTSGKCCDLITTTTTPYK